MKFGICGYGNIGKAVEEIINSSGDELVGIFSRRGKGISHLSYPIYAFEEMQNFEGKIDVMIMCGGSQEDLLWQSPYALKFFNIIDTFDTHALTKSHRESLEKVSKESGKTAIYSCGWDPGVFSIFRTLTQSIFGCGVNTFYGRGVSQGHSEALRNIEGVEDAIQFTIPLKDSLEKAKNKKEIIPEEQRHLRLCYVCKKEGASESEIEEKILQTKNYFEGQKVQIKFVGKKRIEALKKNMGHKGIVIASDEMSSLSLSAKMKSNPHFTAQIILSFAKIIARLPQGVYCPLDIPVSLLEGQNLL